MKSDICSGSKKSMEILFNVQPSLLSKNKTVPDLSQINLGQSQIYLR
jgi:hypothetical protein